MTNPIDNSTAGYQTHTPMTYSPSSNFETVEVPPGGSIEISTEHMHAQSDSTLMAEVNVYDPQPEQQDSASSNQQNNTSLSLNMLGNELAAILNVKNNTKTNEESISHDKERHTRIFKPYIKIFNMTTNTNISIYNDYKRIINNIEAEREHKQDGCTSALGSTLTHGSAAALTSATGVAGGFLALGLQISSGIGVGL